MDEKQSISGLIADAERRGEGRRQGSRRLSVAASVDEDNRKGDRRDRGGDRREDAPDRRGHFQNLFSPNDNFLYEVFMWLIDNSEGEWTAGPNENDTEDDRVTCRIRFDQKSDLEAFINWLKEWEEKAGSSG
ncbi:MAG: hypothetical protein HOB79_18760 [Rhodospirillaceae bacterium]|nr:hypothetical protein [Rhodospirillaceae bacterium]MBT4703118.1 hypothetical protein [Rhodospirillaceae bacterium]MBT6221161.1 hypothetical protein [Rhodospirillaceae bacterium]MBT6364179.1 hypothetical protein [Rhodospirillaceae bacterium]MBT8002072.1 hypothetical protein [Rhodospirillales bacterium]